MTICISQEILTQLSDRALERLFAYYREMLFSRHLERSARDQLTAMLTAIRMERRRRIEQRVTARYNTAPKGPDLSL